MSLGVEGKLALRRALVPARARPSLGGDLDRAARATRRRRSGSRRGARCPRGTAVGDDRRCKAVVDDDLRRLGARSALWTSPGLRRLHDPVDGAARGCRSSQAGVVSPRRPQESESSCPLREIRCAGSARNGPAAMAAPKPAKPRTCAGPPLKPNSANSTETRREAARAAEPAWAAPDRSYAAAPCPRRVSRVPSHVDVVAVIGARDAARVAWAVGVPAVDELGRAQRPVRVPRQTSPSTAPMSKARPAKWSETLPSTV
jgi:hypothetical protein